MEDQAILAPVRWNVEKKRREWDAELIAFRKKQQKKLMHIRLSSRKKILEFYERLYSTIRWSNPPIAAPFQKILFDYADFLICPNIEQIFPQQTLLDAWFDRQEHRQSCKIADDIKRIFEKIHSTVSSREDNMNKTNSHLESTTEMMVVKKEGQLRWKMETNFNKRDQFWNIWYFSSHGMMDELIRFLQDDATTIDELDQDFGLAAIHYTCKRGELKTTQLLLQYGADPQRRAQDGRTPLHFAAAYGGKALVLHLMSLGIDVHLRDNFGCSPLDLAEQNGNKVVVACLRNWDQYALIDDQGLDESTSNSGTSNVMNSYSNVSYDIMPDNANGKGNNNNVAITNTTRIQSRVSSNSIDDSDSDDDNGNGSGSSNSDSHWVTPLHIINTMSLSLQVLTNRLQGQGPGPGQENHTRNSSTNNINGSSNSNQIRHHHHSDPMVEMRLCERHAKLCFQENLNEEGLMSLRRRWTVALRLQQTTTIPPITASTSYTPSLSIDAGDTLAILSVAHTLPSTNSDMGASSCSSITTGVIRGGGRSGMSGVFLLQVGGDLVEALVTHGAEGEAEDVLSRLVGVVGVGVTSRVAVLYRRCQVLLFLYDRMETDGKLTARTRCSLVNNNIDISNSMTVSGNGNGSESDNYMMTRSRSLHRSHTRSICERRRRLSTGMSKYLDDEDVYELSTVLYIFACTCEASARTAVGLLSELHAEDVLEPPALCPLLEALAEALDRQGRPAEALGHIQHAVTICERSLGPTHAETVRIMLEGIRLQTCCATSDGFTHIGRVATDVSRRLDKLSRSSPEEAATLAKRCAELVALTRLLEAKQAELPHLSVTAGSAPSFKTSVAAQSKLLSLKTTRYSRVGSVGELDRWTALTAVTSMNS